MRGETERQATLLLGLTPEGFVPREHPRRRIKPLVDSALGRISPLFDEIYAAGGRPAIPPEHLLKSSLLMAFYTIRSERQFCERLLEADPCSSQGAGCGASATQGSGTRGAPARDARLDHWSRGAALLPGSRADREPARPRACAH